MEGQKLPAIERRNFWAMERQNRCGDLLVRWYDESRSQLL
jgi:hypothetical protein